MYNPQLETFICVADMGSFAKAAQALYISPTAVIKQVNLLEDRLGVKLLERTHRGIRLTEAGAVFYPDAKQIISLSQDALARVQSVQKGRQRIRIGTSVLTARPILKAVLDTGQEKCPGLKVQLVPFENTPESSNGILSALGENVDIVIAMCELSELRKYAVQPLSFEPLCVGVSTDHPLAQKERLSIADLQELKLLIFQRGFNSAVDTLRNDLERSSYRIRLMNIPFMDLRIFNHCADSMDGMIAIEKWDSIHPGVKIMPVDWSYTVPYGLLYSYRAPEPVIRFVREMAGSFKELVRSGGHV